VLELAVEQQLVGEQLLGNTLGGAARRSVMSTIDIRTRVLPRSS
jgi:hypothetical protein